MKDSIKVPVDSELQKKLEMAIETLKECERDLVWRIKGPYGPSPMRPDALLEHVQNTLQHLETDK